jgi:hypothetical protein
MKKEVNDRPDPSSSDLEAPEPCRYNVSTFLKCQAPLKIDRTCRQATPQEANDKKVSRSEELKTVSGDAQLLLTAHKLHS